MHRRVLLGTGVLLLGLLYGCSGLDRVEEEPGVAGDGTPAPVVDAPPGPDAASDPAETLFVLTQSGSQVDREFRSSTGPKLQALADRLGLTLEAIEVEVGAPGPITITPTIVFQNHAGRAVYQGRFTELDRLEKFILTVRQVPQPDARLTREDVVVWRDGRAQVAAAIKITPVSGTVPDGLDAEGFVAEARRSIVAGFRRLQSADRVELERTDRTFYLDCYPYADDAGTLHLTLAIFSQFDCKEPISARFDRPISGPWAERDRVLRQAGTDLERRLFEELGQTDTGDGFRPIAKTVPARSWEELGYPLPARPAGAVTAPVGATPPTSWRVEKPDPERPPVLFRFQEPLDYYAGVVKEIEGALELGDGDPMQPTGWVEVKTPSVTMGEPDLDDSIHAGDMLAVQKHPASRFTIREVRGDRAALEYGASRSLEFDGTFSLKGIEIPTTARILLEPTLDAGGRPRLQVNGSFTIRLRDAFGITGPDGPSPANDTVLISVNFRMRPASELP